MLDVTALGELLIDFATQSTDEAGYPTMAAHPGGAPGNFLAALNQYGAKTAFLGKVGDDAFGRLLLGTLREAGIATGGIVRDPRYFTTLAFVTFDPSGDRQFSFARKPGADTMLTFEELDLSLIDQARVFHFGTLSLTGEPVRTTTQKAVAYARERGKLLTFDPNLRLPLWDDPEEAKAQILWGLARADVVKISLEEVEFLWGLDEQVGGEKLLTEYGVQLAFVTLGADGCYYVNQNGSGYTNYTGPLRVVDTTGAGDIFGGSAVSQLLRLGKAPAALAAEEVHQAATFACTAASLSTQYFGGISSVQPEKIVRTAMGL